MLYVGAVFVLSVAFGTTARADGADVSVRFAVESTSIRLGGSATNELLLGNAGAKPVTLAKLAVFAPAGVVVKGLEKYEEGPTTIQPKAVLRVPVNVSTVSGFQPGKVTVSTVATTQGEKGDVSSVVSAALDLSAANDGAAPVSITTLDMPAKLHDNQVATGVALVRNMSSAKLSSVQLVAVGSGDVTVAFCESAAECKKPTPTSILSSVGAYEVVPVTVQFSVADQVRTGPQVVCIVTRVDGSAPVPATNISVDLSVFGLDFVGPLNLTAIVLLPGVVALALFGLLCKLYPGGRFRSLPEISSPTAFLFTVPVSGAVVAGLIAGGLHVQDDVGTWDVVALFGGGVAVAAVAWTIVASTYYRVTGRKTFRVSDSPGKVLKRLGYRDASARCPSVTVDAETLVVLDVGDEKWWVCQRIQVSIEDGHKGGTVETDLNEAIRNSDFEKMRKVAKDAGLKLVWQGSGGPRQVDPNPTAADPPTVPILKLE